MWPKQVIFNIKSNIQKLTPIQFLKDYEQETTIQGLKEVGTIVSYHPDHTI